MKRGLSGRAWKERRASRDACSGFFSTPRTADWTLLTLEKRGLWEDGEQEKGLEEDGEQEKGLEEDGEGERDLWEDGEGKRSLEDGEQERSRGRAWGCTAGSSDEDAPYSTAS